MSPNNHKLVVKFAAKGTPYRDENGTITPSTVGHVWFELYHPNSTKPYLSSGWAPRKGSHTNFQDKDHERYIDTGKNINSITVEITPQQATKLKFFHMDAQAGKVKDFHPAWYPFNSCIDYTGRALDRANLVDSGFDGKNLNLPVAQFKPFLIQIAKNQVKNGQGHMDLEFKFMGESYKLNSAQKNSRDIIETIDHLHLQNIGRELRSDVWMDSPPQTAQPASTSAQDMFNSLLNAYSAGKTDVLSVIDNHTYTQRRETEVQQLAQQQEQQQAAQEQEISQPKRTMRMG